MERLVLVGHGFGVVGRGGPDTEIFIMRNEYFPNKELYTTKTMVHITEEGPKEYLLDLDRNYLYSSIDSALVPLEEGVYRFR